MNRFLNALTLVSGFVSLAALSVLIVEIAFVLTETTRQLFSQLYWIIILFFCIDIVLRFAISQKRKRVFFARIMDYALILPLVKWLIPNGVGVSMYTIVQLSLIAVIMGRLSHINVLFKKLRFNPAQLFISGFVLSIFIGALLLSLPQSRVSADSFGFIDALFTATSAICVTGLTTLDINTHFSGLGQAVILILIQLGGLGIMTFYAMISLVLNRKLSQEERLEYQTSYQAKSSAGTFGLIRNIFIMTFLFEIAGALLFLFLWRDRFSSMWETVYYAVFHSVSAFCNAGFSLFPDSLSVFVNEPVVLLIFSGLIILGGIGFPVIMNITRVFFERDKVRFFSLQTKLTLAVTSVLLILGTLLILISEYDNSLAEFSWMHRSVLAFFHSVSARTAGFTSLSLTGFNSATVWALITLMFIGASPGSTGGGIKTTTFGVLLLSFWSTIRGRFRILVFGRTINLKNIFKALSITTLSILIIGVFFYLILMSESQVVFPLLFEVVSAFATVGFSLELTPRLSESGKLLLCVLMLLGRVGPLTVAFALSRKRKQGNYSFPEEKILLG